MAYLVEVSEFVDSILRIDVNTPVRGFDGKDLGPSNEQALVLANRTMWLKEQLGIIKTKQDNQRDPENVMYEHLQAEDPHPQYLTEERGDGLFVDKSIGNKPNGYLQLDEKGLFPANLAKLYEARYLIATDKEDRLSAEINKNITICFQRDDNKIYYLNPGEEPSIESNWLAGEESSLAPVVTVFGRMGEIVAQDNDYTADQIAETSKRKFVSPKEKTNWDNKQNALVSGKNIKTLLGLDITGEGNIALEDIGEFPKAVNNVLSGDGIEITYDETKQKTVLKVDAKGANEIPALTVVDVDNAVAEEIYKYPIDELNFDYQAQALKRVVLSPASDERVDYLHSKPQYETNTLPSSDDRGYFITGDKQVISLSETTGVESFISKAIEADSLPTNAVKLDCTVDIKTIDVVPIFTSINDTNGFSLFSTKIYGTFYPWKAFQGPLSESERKEVSNTNYWSDNQIWRNKTIEPYLGLKRDTPIEITGYGFANFESFYWKSTSTPPTEWIFQGRDEDTDEWIDLDHQKNQTIMKTGNSWSNYRLAKPAAYKQYRVLIKDVILPGARACIARFQLYNDLGVLFKDKDDAYYTVLDSGYVQKVSVESKEEFSRYQFRATPKPIDLTSLEDKFPIRVCALGEVDVNIETYQYPYGIGIHDPILERENWDGLYSVTIVDVVSPNDPAALSAAVTPDGQFFYIWKNNGWEVIGEYLADEESAMILQEQGMSIAVFNSIPEEGWKAFFKIVKNAVPGIATARIMESASVLPVGTMLSISFRDVYGWEKMSYDKVKIVLSEKYLSFTPVEEGTYKFCYRFM